MTTVAAPTIQPHKVELVLRQLDGLPPLPPIISRILSLTGEPKTVGKEIVALIGHDASLSARLLSTARVSGQGRRPEPVNISDVVAQIGCDAVLQAAMGAKVIEVFGPGAAHPEDGGLDRTEFWKYCLGVAWASGRVAVLIESPLGSVEAFLCGLLHDIGIAALDAVMPKSFSRIVRRLGDTADDVHGAEQAVLGVDHSVVGHRLAKRWGLPRTVAECAWLHDQDPDGLPVAVAAGRHVQIVQLAAALVRERRIGYWLPRAERSPRALARRVGLDEASLGEIGDFAAGQVATWSGAMGLGLGRDAYARGLKDETESLTRDNASLRDENQRLARTAGYFSALNYLNRAISPGASVPDACGAAAETLRRAMALDGVLVFAVGEGGHWFHVGVSDGTVRAEIVDRPSADADPTTELKTAVDLARAGTWLSPPGPRIAGLAERFRPSLGTGTAWLLPLVRDQQGIGGAVFCSSADRLAQWHSDSAEVEELCSACGLAIAHARSEAAAVGSEEAFADVNRRQSAVQAETWRTRSLDTVAKMAAGAAHEMNTALSVISGRAQMLRGQVEGADARAVDAIVEQADICSNVVTELMEFARPPAPRPEALNLLDLLEGLTARMTFEGVEAASSVTLEIPSDTPRVRFDRQQLMGTFRELIANAAAATDPATRRLTVKAGGQLTDKSVVVAVIDNGSGMPPEVVERALDPFFSYRPAGRGRGLGLARVQQWMRLNGGSIRIDSSPGQGTRVQLRLPGEAGGLADGTGV